MIPIENIEKTFSDLNNLKKAYALYSQSLPKKELTIVQSLLSFLEISIEYYRYLNKSNSSNDGNINVIIKKNYGNILENIENNNNNNSPTGKNNNIMENIGSSNDKLTIDKEINNPHMNNIANTNNINKEKSVSVDSFSQDKAIINPNASAIIEEIKYTNLNRSIAFQFLKDFKDLKLMRPTLKNHRVLNTSLQLNNSKNQNASLNLESVFEDLRRKQKEIPFVKKEIIAVESQNSRLIWKDEREV